MSILDDKSKISIRYDKLNTKYNRLWEQVTNLSIFIFASIGAYSIAYVQYSLDNPFKWTIFLDKAIIPIMAIIFPIVIITTILLVLLITTGKSVHKIIREYKIYQ